MGLAQAVLNLSSHDLGYSWSTNQTFFYTLHVCIQFMLRSVVSMHSIEFTSYPLFTHESGTSMVYWFYHGYHVSSFIPRHLRGTMSIFGIIFVHFTYLYWDLPIIILQWHVVWLLSFLFWSVCSHLYFFSCGASTCSTHAKWILFINVFSTFLWEIFCHSFWHKDDMLEYALVSANIFSNLHC